MKTASLVLAMLLVGSPLQAQVIDLSTIKCKEFVASGKEEIGIMLAWLNAYYKDEDDPPIIDFGKLTSDAQKLGAYCGSNPEVGLITAADTLFNK
jgi:acid stress chaperone HdeB